MANATKMNYAELDSIAQDTEKAFQQLEAALAVWGDKFDNLYQFISGESIKQIYDDNDTTCKGPMGGSPPSGTDLVACGGAVPSFVTAGAPAYGDDWNTAIAGAGVTAIATAYGDSTKDAYEAFKTTMEQCVTGSEGCYTKIQEVQQKLNNAKISFTQMKTLVNEFEQAFKGFDPALVEECGLTGKLGFNGDTLTSVTSEVTVYDENGQAQTIYVNASEALNGLVTYMDVGLSTRQVADALYRNGVEIDMTKLMTATGADNARQLESGLFSREFIDFFLPEYNVVPADTDALKKQLAEATGLSEEDIGKFITDNPDLINTIGLTAAVIGGASMAIDGIIDKDKTKEQWGKKREYGDDDVTDIDPSVSPSPSPTPSTTPTYPPGGGGPHGSSPTPTPTPSATPTEEPTPSGEPITFEPITEEQLPEQIEQLESEKDFDQLARDELEFGQKYEDIEAHRIELNNMVEEAFLTGNFDELKTKLASYGFNSAEIEKILTNREWALRAVMLGDQRAQLAAKALELAKAAGVENYDTIYDDRIDFDKDIMGADNELLMLASEDPTVVALKTKVDEVKVEYDKAYQEADEALKAAQEAKKTMEETQAKYQKEFGSSDASKWDEASIKAYNETIVAYNTAVKLSTEKTTAFNTVKETYSKAKEDFTQAKKDYYEKVKSGTGSQQPEGEVQGAQQEQSQVSEEEAAQQILDSLDIGDTGFGTTEQPTEAAADPDAGILGDITAGDGGLSI